MSHFFRIAFKLAERSTHKNHKHGCIVVRGGAILSKSWNLAWKYCGHSEQRALKRHADDRNYYKGASIFIVRKSGGLSHPCKKCMMAIREAGIYKIYYINADREPECIKVSEAA